MMLTDVFTIKAMIRKICDDKCTALDEYMAQYKDPDDAWERMSIERCADCPLMYLEMEIDGIQDAK